MNLHFERRNGYFISEFEVTNDFNLHIEKDPIGQFIVYQRTAGGAYDLVADFGKNKGDDPIIDYDFSALVYPKYIQIKSSVNPVIATITTNGEVNELVYQEKTINITSNGEVAISADSGYNGLALVNVNVDVPTEGGEINDGDIMYFYDGTQYSAYLSLESGNYVGGYIRNRTTSGWLNEPINKGTDEDYDIINSFTITSPLKSTLYFNGDVKAKCITWDGSKFDMEMYSDPTNQQYNIYYSIPEGLNYQDIYKKVLEVTNLNTNKTYTILIDKMI